MLLLRRACRCSNGGKELCVWGSGEASCPERADCCCCCVVGCKTQTAPLSPSPCRRLLAPLSPSPCRRLLAPLSPSPHHAGWRYASTADSWSCDVVHMGLAWVEQEGSARLREQEAGPRKRPSVSFEFERDRREAIGLQRPPVPPHGGAPRHEKHTHQLLQRQRRGSRRLGQQGERLVRASSSCPRSPARAPSQEPRHPVFVG